MSDTWWHYWGCQRPPFSRDLPVERLFPAPSWQEARARIRHVLEDRGFLVLTGESGVGKTTALRAVLHPLNPAQYQLCYLPVAETWTPRHLYRAVAHALAVPVSPRTDDTERAVRHTLWTLATQHGRLPVLVLDESHLLSPHVLQSLRLLLNFAMDTTAPLALLCVGHTELRRKLALRPLEAIRQRVTVAYHLAPLTVAETADYLRHHLQAVGVERPVFTEAALAAAHAWSQGLPRRIHHGARASLMAAWSQQHQIVDEAMVAIAEAELQWAGTV